MPANVISMFSGNGVTPWHGLGTVVKGLLTADAAIEAAGLDWDVTQAPLYHLFNGKLHDVPKNVANVRSDTGDVLGVVGTDYVPLQNRDAFNFFDDVVASGRAKYESAGFLGDGRVWILASGMQDDILPGDSVQEHLLLTHSHDGSQAVRMFHTNVRVVCMNTLNMALRQAGKRTGFRTKHVGDILWRVQQAREDLNITPLNEEWWETTKLYRDLAETHISDLQAEEIITAVFPERPDAERDTWTDKRDAVRGLYNDGDTVNVSGADGTAWAMYNAITEWSDHHRTGPVTEARIVSATMGTHADFKAQALATVVGVSGL
jgi:phage/plasmid-like protein (TIGR03299 family)